MIKKQNFLTCSGKNQATFCCLDIQCKQQILLICSNDNCKCQQEHQECSSRGNVKFIQKKIKEKNNSSESFKIQIQNIFQKVIDDIRGFRDKILIEIQNQLKTLSRSNAEKIFINLYQGKQQEEKLTIKQVKTLWQPEDKKQSQFGKALKQADCFEARISQKIKELQDYINNLIKQTINKKQQEQLLKYQNSFIEIIQRIKNGKYLESQIKKYEQNLKDHLHNNNQLKQLQNPLQFSLNNIISIYNRFKTPVKLIQHQIFNMILGYQGKSKQNLSNINFIQDSLKYFLKFEQLDVNIGQQVYLQFLSKIFPQYCSQQIRKAIPQQLKYIKQHKQQIFNHFIQILSKYQDKKKINSFKSIRICLIAFIRHQALKIYKQLNMTTFKIYLCLEFFIQQEISEFSSQYKQFIELVQQLTQNILQRLEKMNRQKEIYIKRSLIINQINQHGQQKPKINIKIIQILNLRHMNFQTSTTLQEIQDAIETAGQVDKLVELNLSDIKIGKFTSQMKKAIQRCTNLQILILNGCELDSLDNLPQCDLTAVDLTGNNIGDSEIEKLARYENLGQLILNQNKISKLDSIKVLSKLENLQQVDFSDNPVVKQQRYREFVFQNLSKLQILDRFNREGNQQVQEENFEDVEHDEQQD